MSIPTYEGLLDSARFFADRALRDYTNGDHRAVLMDAGTLLEHASKALLIKTNPAYLVEMKPGGFDHLLRLTGRADRAPQVGALRTIGAAEAVARVQKLVDIRTPKADLDQVLQVRNGIVHASAFDATRTRQLLTSCLRYCDEVYNALGVGERWGEHIELVVRLVEQTLSDIEHEFHRKVTAAKARLRALINQIPESERVSVAAARQSVLYSFAARGVYQSSGADHSSEMVDCPVCNHKGALCSGPLRMEQELMKSARFDEPDSLEIIDIWIEPETLQCRVCGVALSNVDELRLAGIPPRLEFTEKSQPWGLVMLSTPPDDFYDGGPWTVD